MLSSISINSSKKHISLLKIAGLVATCSFEYFCESYIVKYLTKVFNRFFNETYKDFMSLVFCHWSVCVYGANHISFFLILLWMWTMIKRKEFAEEATCSQRQKKLATFNALLANLHRAAAVRSSMPFTFAYVYKEW